MAERDITIYLNAIDNASQALNKVGDSIDVASKKLASFSQKQEALASRKQFTNALDELGVSFDKTTGRFKDASGKFVKFENVLKGVEEKTTRVNAQNEKLDKFFNGFPAQLLSIGFLFGSIGATATSFTKQALNSFESLGSTLTEGRLALLQLQAELNLLFLSFAESSAMKDFLNKIKELVVWFNNLEPATQNNIFSLVAWGGVIATIIGAIGFLGLGLIGLVQLFDLLGPAITLVTTKLGTGVVGALSMAASVFLLAAAIGFLTGHGDKVGQALGKMFEGLGNIIDGITTGNLPKLQLGFAQVAFGVIEIFLAMAVGILQIANKLVGFLIKIFGEFFIDKMGEFVNYFIEQINQIINAINAIASFLKLPFNIKPLDIINVEQIKQAKSAFSSFIDENVTEVDAFWNTFLDKGVDVWKEAFKQFLGIDIGELSAPGTTTNNVPAQNVNQITINNDFNGNAGEGNIFGFANYEEFKDALFADLEELINNNTGGQ